MTLSVWAVVMPRRVIPEAWVAQVASLPTEQIGDPGSPGDEHRDDNRRSALARSARGLPQEGRHVIAEADGGRCVVAVAVRGACARAAAAAAAAPLRGSARAGWPGRCSRGCGCGRARGGRACRSGPRSRTSRGWRGSAGSACATRGCSACPFPLCRASALARSGRRMRSVAAGAAAGPAATASLAIAEAARRCATPAATATSSAPAARQVLGARRIADPGDRRAQHALDVLELLGIVGRHQRQRAALPCRRGPCGRCGARSRPTARARRS